MKISIENKDKVGKLVTLFRHLKSLTETVNMMISSEKLYIQGLDASHACLIEVQIQSDWFDAYESLDMTLGVSCGILFKVIACWQEGQVISMTCPLGSDKLHIHFEGEGTMTKDFALPLMNIDCDLMTVPQSEYQVDLTISSNIFKDLITELTIFNDTIKFNCTDEIVSLVADGDAGKINITIKNEDIEELAIEEDFELAVSISANYIAQICNFHRLTNMIYIHCSDDCPIKMHYSLDNEDSASSKSYVRFFVATKIDD